MKSTLYIVFEAETEKIDIYYSVPAIEQHTPLKAINIYSFFHRHENGKQKKQKDRYSRHGFVVMKRKIIKPKK